MTDIKEKWINLIKQYRDDETFILKSYRNIKKRYNTLFRRYHNLNHIAELLGLFEKHKTLIRDQDCFQFAVWFHDIVYKTYRRDNEQKSAESASEFLRYIGAEKEFIEKISEMIMLTQSHDLKTGSSDYRIFIDIDLAILGSEREKYISYLKKIRMEYFFIPSKIYNKNRSILLEKFLKRSRIYHSDVFHNEFENSARQNLQYEIDLLSKQMK